MNTHKNNSGEKQELFLLMNGSSPLLAECVTNPLSAGVPLLWLVGPLKIFLRGLTLTPLPIAGVHTLTDGLTDDTLKTGAGLAAQGLLKSSGERFSSAADDAQSFL